MYSLFVFLRLVFVAILTSENKILTTSKNCPVQGNNLENEFQSSSRVCFILHSRVCMLSSPCHNAGTTDLIFFFPRVYVTAISMSLCWHH